MDFVTLISDNWDATTEIKLEFLDDFCRSCGYAEGDKTDFANEAIKMMIVGKVDNYRERKSKEDATFTKLEIKEV